MKKLFFNVAVPVTAALVLLNVCKLIEITIDCPVCNKPTYRENILERIASGFETNFIHQHCVKDLKYKKGNVDDSVSN